MSKTANIPNVEYHIDEDGLKDTKTKVRFNPENITKELVEFYADKAGLDKDNYDVDAAVKEWREIIESGHGLAVDKGEVIALEFVHVGQNHLVPRVRDIKSGWSAFQMGLVERVNSPAAFKYPTTVAAIYEKYLEQKSA